MAPNTYYVFSQWQLILLFFVDPGPKKAAQTLICDQEKNHLTTTHKVADGSVTKLSEKAEAEEKTDKLDFIKI